MLPQTGNVMFVSVLLQFIVKLYEIIQTDLGLV